MQLGMIGLGRMGGNMVKRLLDGGHECVVYDSNEAKREQLAAIGAVAAASLDEFAANLAAPRAAWVMVPAGAPTEQTVHDLAQRFSSGDTIIDGGNSYYKDDVRRAADLRPRGIHYVDVGTSGGIWGAERGYCLMMGGDKDAVERLEPIFRTLAPGKGTIEETPNRQQWSPTADEGFLYCGPSGAGHFVKMVHNGIEYGLMQAYAEGFDVLRNACCTAFPEDQRYALPLQDIAEVWRRGSVVSSWLLDLTAIALSDDPALAQYSGYVQDSGEGRWTIMAAVEEAIPTPVLSASLYARFRSRQDHTFADKMLSAMRAGFGGHIEAVGKP